MLKFEIREGEGRLEHEGSGYELMADMCVACLQLCEDMAKQSGAPMRAIYNTLIKYLNRGIKGWEELSQQEDDHEQSDPDRQPDARS